MQEELSSAFAEMDAISLNPCMATILAIIDYMHANFPVAPGEEMAKWMAFMHAKMSAPGNPHIFSLNGN